MFSCKAKASRGRRVSLNTYSGPYAARDGDPGPVHNDKESDEQGVQASRLRGTRASNPGQTRTYSSAVSPEMLGQSAAIPTPASSRPTSKAHALATFQSLVAGTSRAQLLEPPQHNTATGAAAAVPFAMQPAAAPPLGQHHTTDVTAAQPQAKSAQAHQQHHTSCVTFQSAVPAAVKPSQLLPRTATALNQLLQQLQQRSLTFLYQFDHLLQGAHNALDALCAYINTKASANDPTALTLQMIAQEQHGQQQQDETAGITQLTGELLQICLTCWEATCLLLEYHHAAEPQNTSQQAGHICNAAKSLWELYESVQANTADATGTNDYSAACCEAGAIADASLLSNRMLGSLSVLVKVSSLWSVAGKAAESDWCHQQLRKQLPAIIKTGQDDTLRLQTRQQLQRLQFEVLQESVIMAAKQKQQALWANLKSILQQLLGNTVLEPEDAISMCLSMSGALADQASSSSSTGTAAAGQEGSILTLRDTNSQSVDIADATESCQLLQLAAELLEHCRQKALQLQQQMTAAVTAAAGDAVQSAALQHITSIQQQVLLQLGQACLNTKQYTQTLACVNTLQGLAAGRGPIPGLIKLSSLALLGQGKLVPATAQLSAWLKQGVQAGQQLSGQSAEEAVSAVDAFLKALDSSNRHSGTYARNAAAAAGETGGDGSTLQVQELVKQVADAAVERCQGQPAVAVAVVMQLMQMEVGSSCYTSSLEQLILHMLRIEEVAQQLIQQPEDCQKCQAMLHQRGQTHYEAQHYSAAISLLTPAVFFGSSLSVGKSARLLAMSLIKVHQPQKALDYVALAEQQEGQCTALGCLIRLHALLLLGSSAAAAAGKVDAAVAAAGSGDGNGVPECQAAAVAADSCIATAVRKLASCADFNNEAMQAAFNLCMQDGNRTAAWQVLNVWSSAATEALTADRQKHASRRTSKGQGGGLPSPAATATAAFTSPPAATTTAALTSPPAADNNNENNSPRLLQTLALMQAVFQQEQNSSSSQHMLSSRLDDMCSVCRSCCKTAVQHHTNSDNYTTAMPVGCVSGCYTPAQLMWLADVSLQLGIAAAEAGCLECCLGMLTSAAELHAGLLSQEGDAQRPDRRCSNKSKRQSKSSETAAAATGDGQQNGNTTAAATVPQEQQQQGDHTAAATVAEADSAPTTSQELLVEKLCLGLLTAVAVAIPLLLQAHTQDPAQQQHLEQAKQLLQLAQQQAPMLKQLDNIAVNLGSSYATVASTMESLQHVLQKLSFTVACRQQQEAKAKQHLQALVTHPSTTAAEFAAFAKECLAQGMPWRHEGLAALAYGFMLRLAAAAGAVDAVLDAVLGIMNLVGSHSVKVQACKKAAAVLRSAQQQHGPTKQADSPAGLAAAAVMSAAVATKQECPSHKLQWLISTCWNSAVQLSSSNVAIAQQYLSCVELLGQRQLQGSRAVHWLLHSKRLHALKAALTAARPQANQQRHSRKRGGSPDVSVSRKKQVVAAGVTGASDVDQASEAAGDQAKHEQQQLEKRGGELQLYAQDKQLRVNNLQQQEQAEYPEQRLVHAQAAHHCANALQQQRQIEHREQATLQTHAQGEQPSPNRQHIIQPTQSPLHAAAFASQDTAGINKLTASAEAASEHAGQQEQQLQQEDAGQGEAEQQHADHHHHCSSQQAASGGQATLQLLVQEEQPSSNHQQICQPAQCPTHPVACTSHNTLKNDALIAGAAASSQAAQPSLTTRHISQPLTLAVEGSSVCQGGRQDNCTGDAGLVSNRKPSTGFNHAAPIEQQQQHTLSQVLQQSDTIMNRAGDVAKPGVKGRPGDGDAAAADAHALPASEQKEVGVRPCDALATPSSQQQQQHANMQECQQTAEAGWQQNAASCGGESGGGSGGIVCSHIGGAPGHSLVSVPASTVQQYSNRPTCTAAAKSQPAHSAAATAVVGAAAATSAAEIAAPVAESGMVAGAQVETNIAVCVKNADRVATDNAARQPEAASPAASPITQLPVAATAARACVWPAGPSAHRAAAAPPDQAAITSLPAAPSESSNHEVVPCTLHSKQPADEGPTAGMQHHHQQQRCVTSEVLSLAQQHHCQVLQEGSNPAHESQHMEQQQQHKLGRHLLSQSQQCKHRGLHSQDIYSMLQRSQGHAAGAQAAATTEPGYIQGGCIADCSGSPTAAAAAPPAAAAVPAAETAMGAENDGGCNCSGLSNLNQIGMVSATACAVSNQHHQQRHSVAEAAAAAVQHIVGNMDIDQRLPCTTAVTSRSVAASMQPATALVAMVEACETKSGKLVAFKEQQEMDSAAAEVALHAAFPEAKSAAADAELAAAVIPCALRISERPALLKLAANSAIMHCMLLQHEQQQQQDADVCNNQSLAEAGVVAAVISAAATPAFKSSSAVYTISQAPPGGTQAPLPGCKGIKQQQQQTDKVLSERQLQGMPLTADAPKNVSLPLSADITECLASSCEDIHRCSHIKPNRQHGPSDAACTSSCSQGRHENLNRATATSQHVARHLSEVDCGVQLESQHCTLSAVAAAAGLAVLRDMPASSTAAAVVGASTTSDEAPAPHDPYSEAPAAAAHPTAGAQQCSRSDSAIDWSDTTANHLQFKRSIAVACTQLEMCPVTQADQVPGLGDLLLSDGSECDD